MILEATSQSSAMAGFALNLTASGTQAVRGAFFKDKWRFASTRRAVQVVKFASKIEQLTARIRELETQNTELLHLQAVQEATRASARSLAEGWDNPLDAKYDDL